MIRGNFLDQIYFVILSKPVLNSRSIPVLVMAPSAKMQTIAPSSIALLACLIDRMIFFGEGSLQKAIHEFVAHYHRERNHQGLGNRLIIPPEPHAESSGAIRRRQRLGGMLNYYYRQAA